MLRARFQVPYEAIERTLSEHVNRYHLNEDQRRVLRDCAVYLSDAEESLDVPVPIILVHGVFGSGKSFLLSVLIKFLSLLSSQAPNPFKVLISSGTNVAVDRVLLGLLEQDFESMIRVGSLKKIAKPLLPLSAQMKANSAEEIQELVDMLKSGDLTPSDTR